MQACVCVSVQESLSKIPFQAHKGAGMLHFHLQTIFQVHKCVGLCMSVHVPHVQEIAVLKTNPLFAQFSSG